MTVVLQTCAQEDKHGTLTREKPKMKTIIAAVVLVLACVAGTSYAQENKESEIRAIQAQLNLIQQQQQSVYQEFQMILELQRQTLSQGDRFLINYDDVVRNREDREFRSNQYATEMNNSYIRHRDLEEQKGPLIQRLNELMQQR